MSQYRSFSGRYLNLERRFQYAVQGFSQTQFFYGQFQNVFYDPAFSGIIDRDLAVATQTYARRHGRSASGRSTATAGSSCPAASSTTQERSRTRGCEEYSQDYQQQQFGRQLLNNGTMVPLGVAFVQETTIFREFGPLAGNTVRLSLRGRADDRQLAVAADRRRRRAQVLPPRRHRACSRCAPAASRAGATTPATSTSAATPRCAATSTCDSSARTPPISTPSCAFPLIHAMATPIGILGGIRGTLFANVGGAFVEGTADSSSWTNDTSIERPIVGYANDPNDPAPAADLRRSDGWSTGSAWSTRGASYGIGLQTFALGFPMHFDWSWRTLFNKDREDVIYAQQGGSTRSAG